MSGDDADHVVEAIDNALRDWSVSGDAMRHAPDAPRVKVPPVPHIEVRADLLRDLVLFGNAYVDEATGRRIDPMTVVRRRDGRDALSVHASPGVIDVNQAIRSVPPSVLRIHAALQQMAREMVPAMQNLATTMRKFEDAARRAGVVPDPPPDDPRERALRARRNRSTGPARDPFTHRGNR